MHVLLLVTWFYAGQPAASYQAEFSSMDACSWAEFRLLREREQLEATARGPDVQQLPGGGSIVSGGDVVPRLSTVCVPKG
jgi:hypothetical protein